MEVSKLKYLIWDYIRSINENTNKAFSPICEQYGLTMLQVKILMELGQDCPFTVGHLAEKTYIASTNLSAMCKKLESMSLVERTRDRKDERIVKVVLTEKGKRTIKEIDQVLSEKLALINENDHEDFETILRGLEKLNEVLEKLGHS